MPTFAEASHEMCQSPLLFPPLSGAEHPPLDVLETPALEQGHDQLEFAKQLAPEILAVRPTEVLLERAGPDRADRADRAVKGCSGVKSFERLEEVGVDCRARVNRVEQDEGAAVDKLQTIR